jgi:DNA-binding PadR family transcriptional regulator
MSLEHIMLAMLGKPRSGYDMKAEFEGGARFFWSAEFGQIYPTLRAMERKGWIESHGERSTKGPQRKVYRRTGEGARVFHEWLRSGPTIGSERFAWIAQLIYFGELGDLQASERFVESLRIQQSGVRDALSGALKYVEADHPQGETTMSDVVFHEWLALQVGIRAIQARIDWCEEAVRHIHARRARGAG